MQEEKSDTMEVEGVDLVFDTTYIFDHLDLESLNYDEILEVKSKLGKYAVYVQMKHLVFDSSFCHIKLYRVIVYGKLNDRENLF